MWLQLRQEHLLHLPFVLLVLATAASASSRMMRGASDPSFPSSNNTTTSVAAIATAPVADKLLLLNDLSLEQAYLHRSASGAVPGAAGASASLAQQAARLAAGSYAGTTGQAPGGWRVQSTYKNLNSVAVLSTRVGAVNGREDCALAFRGSDDRLDWRNDYMARPFPLLLCGEDEEGKDHFFMEMLTRADNVKEEERKDDEERRRGRRRRQTPPPIGGQPAKDSTKNSSSSSTSTSNNSTSRNNSSSSGGSGGSGSNDESNRIASAQLCRRQRCPRRLGLYMVHYGFYQSFRLLSSGTTLADDWASYFRNGTCDPDVSIITGHSLGGAFAIYASILGWPGVPITFASPRAVINGSCPTTAGRAATATMPTSTTTTMAEKSKDEDSSHPSLPITRIYLTDDPVPATLPVSDAMRLGIGGPWVHCGCALALQASVPAGGAAEEEEEAEEEKLKKEHFAAKAMGCGSNEPLREAPLLPPPLTLPAPAAVPPPLALGRNRQGGEDEDEEDAIGLVPSGLLAPKELKRHLHTRYVRAIDEACQGPLDSMRCLFDHEV